MTSSETQARRGSARFVWLAIGIILAVLAYTAGWFYVGGVVENNVDRVLRNASGDGGQAECSNREARGYPFRIGLFCDDVSFVDGDQTFRVSGESLRTAAQIYDPYKIVGELDSVVVRMSDVQEGLGAVASHVRFSASLDEPLPQRASALIENLAVDVAPQADGSASLATAPAGEIHMRQREGDLDLAVEGQNVRLTPPGVDGAIDLTRVFLDLTVEDGVRLAGTRPESLRGTSFVVRSASAFLTEDAGFSLAGPISVDADGLVDATLQVKVTKPAAIAERMAQALPDRADEIRTIMAGFAMLGDSASLPLTIEGSRARIAFIKLGRLPPLQ